MGVTLPGGAVLSGSSVDSGQGFVSGPPASAGVALPGGMRLAGRAVGDTSLLAEAVILLRASEYGGSGNWLNEGTLGAAGNAVVVTNDPSAPVYEAGPPALFDVAATDPSNINDENGFVIAADDLGITDQVTVAVLFTPDVTGATSNKPVWHYPGSGGIPSKAGWVFEEVDNIGGGAGSGGFIFGINDGDAIPADGGVFPMASGRQLTVATCDLGDTIRAWRNGTELTAKYPVSVANTSALTSDCETYIGGGQEIEALAIWSRALTPTEVVSLSDLLWL